MPESLAPIGIFDSGIGGLTVWREVVRQLPHESTLYFADQAHVPYGPRPLAEVRRFTEGVTRFLLAQGAKLIVVACNAASGAALHHLRATFPTIPFIGMEPAIKPAAEHTQTGAIGVIATPVTFEGDLYQQLVKRFAGGLKLHVQGCPELVTAVEAGELDTPATHALLERYLAPFRAVGIDQLVLGCTHFPFLSPLIQEIIGPEVTLVDPAPAVARHLGNVLTQHGLRSPAEAIPTHTFYTSGDAARLQTTARTLTGFGGPVLSARWNTAATTVTSGD